MNDDPAELKRLIVDLRRALVESEHRFSSIFENAAVGIAKVDLEGRWLRVNERLCEMIGYTPDEVMNSTFASFTHQDDVEPGIDLFSKLRRGELNHYKIEKRFFHKNGSVVWINVTASLERDRKGNPLSCVAVVEDVTARKRAEEEKRSIDELLAAALRGSDTGTFRWNIQTDALWWDDNMKRLFGYAADSTISLLQHFTQCIHADDRAMVEEAVRRSREQGGDSDIEYRVIWPDGSVHWILDRGRMFYDEHGKPAYMTGACVDVTDRKQAHEALIRTEKLASAGRMAATIAHEINNPLEAITNLLYLSKEDPELPQQVRHYLEQADVELARVAQIARQTLGFYRESTAPSTVAISEVLESVLALHARRLNSKNIRLEREYEKVPPLVGSGGELRQVFSNLLVNSIDVLPANGRITLRVKRSPRFEGVRVIMSDNGPGIPRQNWGRIFEPFFTTKKDVGTGLGLWVTSEIVKKHNGEMRVRSCTRGSHVGASFVMDFPLVKAVPAKTGK